ncbi:MAG: extracellular solute-binding protein [Gemmatimonadetes bacterium]|nr:extracellular solute-binding protein [Gemmatimonadota bacterium]
MSNDRVVTLLKRYPSRCRYKTPVTSFLLLLVSLAGCSDGRTPLVVYSPHGRDLLRLAEEIFEAANPDIDLRTLDMGSQEVLDRVRSERINPQASVWFGGPSSLFARAAADSLLEPYRPEWAVATPERGHGRDDMFFSAYQTVAVIVYNDSAVSADEAPRDWEDLLDAKWKGKVLIRFPLASGTMRTLFGMIMLRSLKATGDTAAGVDWLLRLDAQTRDYTLNPAMLHQKMLRQEGVITMWDLPDILGQRSRGNPFSYVLPTSGTPVIEDAIAIVRGAKEPEAARRFIEFVGSPAFQLRATRDVFRLPARNDLPADSLPQWARDVLEAMVVEDMDWDVLAERGPDWMTYWERNIQGKGD